VNRQHLPVYALALAVAFVGALWAGVPIGTLLFVAAVLACPLMMVFMMRGMHGGSGHHKESPPTPSDRDRHIPPVR
jgi:hypothetical protein